MENKEFTRLTGDRPVGENRAKSPGKSREGGVAMPNVRPARPIFLIVLWAALGGAAFLPPAAVQAVEIVPSPRPSADQASLARLIPVRQEKRYE
jgi:hypothetical protein